ncbi:SEN1 N terminal-domain-containing protein [Diplogelasinospora grovesii]|uniref:SEN1 N terminal-domain-containing protein n=1 Tax=Diplogelasinospora grovesii TaxID=303347 RepID=A0AAN6NA23_9PEZI|nr:SEN1 N terminal-domain-containing protein [Diplogelasinospora grovesii]
MMSSNEVNDALIRYYNDFKDFPPKAHLMCPKVDDDDTTNYDEPDVPDEDGLTAEEKQGRIAESNNRHVKTYYLSLLLAVTAEEASTWLGEWTRSVESCLTKCDACARKWHKSRGRFLKAMEGEFPSEQVNYMEGKLNEFDKRRIDRGLQRARRILEEKGPMTSSKLVDQDVSAVLALFEALCCMPYLTQPGHNADFDYVFEKTQQKKPLRMQGGIIPSMTHFLFNEGSVCRKRFAEAAWDRVPPDSLTEEEWDWAVAGELSSAILNVSLGRSAPAGDKICRFWQGFLLILRSLSEKRILESLRGMEVSPSVYFLALEHMATHSGDALDFVLKGLRALMEKSSKAFWAAFDQVTPSQLVEEIFKSPAFRQFLDTSFTPDRMVPEGSSKIPALAAWVRALIRSLPLTRRSDACESLLRHLFDTFRLEPSFSSEGRATCTLTGLVALGESLEGFLQPTTAFDTGTSLIIVNQLLNRVIQYREVIIGAAELKRSDRYNVGLSDAAMTVIQSAISLDAKATWTEWNALIAEKPVQDAVNRDSGTLWESFLEMLWSGRVDLAKVMLMATMPLRSIEQFMPRRKERLTRGQERFNHRYQQQAAAIGKMLGRLSDFNPADLDMFCSDTQSKTIYPIVASLVHGEEAIREAGFELVKAITGEMQPSEAVNKMLEEYFSPFLNAFSEAVDHITNERDSNSPWSHMSPVLKCSEFVLNGLSDPSVGQLRSKVLTAGEHALVKRWWESEWRAVGHSFKKMRQWHVKVDKKIMEDFCRDVMELAEKLLAQDGLMASALSQNNSNSSGSNGDAAAEAMKAVLEPPRQNSYPLADMLQLRDIYLIQGIIAVIKKLLGRLKENDMVPPQKTIAFLNNMLKKSKLPDGRVDYVQKTNLTNEQRIELLKALGEDAEIEEQFIGIKPGERGAREKERAKRQSKLDFSRAGSAQSLGSARDHILEITPSFEKHKAAREAALLKAKAAPKPDPKLLLANQASLKESRAREKAEKAKRDAEAIAKAKALRAPAKTVPGEGSGLQGIAGVRGKDHAPAQKDEMMVGSSSEDEDGSDDDDDELIMLQAKAKRKTLDEAERRRLQLLAEKHRGPVKKVKVQRSAKDMRARLIPPMDVLHQAILEWDIFHEGNDPPNGFQCLGVSDTYRNPHDYKQTFFPLLINEAWRSFVTDKDETTSKPFGIKVLNRMSVDKFLEVTASVPAAVNKDRGLSEGDIVVFSKGEDPLSQPGELHCLARIWKTTYKKDTVEVVYRLSIKGNQIMSVLLPGSEFNVVRITNMTTIEREYAALESLQYYDLMDEVLRAEPSPILNFGDEALDGVMKNYHLNLGQARAILNAKENDGFTLVQGPPGTGKTKTIVAMVGCLLTGVLKSSTNGAVSITRPGAASNGGAGNAPAKKLLVCAPSNAAVDELVLRLKAGVKTTNGSFHKIDVVRLGRSDAINAAVKDVTLDELVKARMNAEINNNSVSDRDKLHQEAGEIKAKLNELRPQLDAARASEDRAFTMKLQREFDELKRRQAHIGARIDADKNSGNTYARELEIKRRQVQQEILDRAQVLCATLSGSGHEMFKNLNVEFETVIIDEAAQCVELSALIPLKYGCSKCILVGDPKQLPPTVLSQSAARYGYDQSLFVRMQKSHAKDVHLLDTQYRMHPEISRFPSQEFYEGLLHDGADMARLRMQPWHQSALLGPYRFFDVQGSQARGPKNQSLVNEAELKVAMQLYRRFRTDYSSVDLKGKIGIITPYKAQLLRLRQRFTERYGDAITDEIEFNTTDAFQGRECEIIIFSCVRASPTGGIGFMTDIRRMNVGLTRARSSLWILGDARALVQGQYWAKLIDDARRRDRFTSGNIMSLLNQPGAKLPPGAFNSLATKNDNVGGGCMPEPPTSLAPPPLTRDIIELDGDVEMEDAPSASSRASSKSSSSKNELHRTTASGTMLSAPPPAARKRSRERSDESLPDTKKVQQDLDTAQSRPAPKVPKTHKSPKPSLDSSALEIPNGHAPPTHSLPHSSSHTATASYIKPSGGGAKSPNPGSGAPKVPILPSRKKAADPFIRRKPNKR